MCCYGQLVINLMQLGLSVSLFSVCSVQFSPFSCVRLFKTHGLQHARLPYPSPTPGAYSSSCPSTWWCHPTISSCLPLLFLPSMFPTSGSFLMSQFFPSVQFSSVRLFATPWIPAHQASLSITNSQSSLRLTSIESVMPSSHLILCRPLLLLPPVPPSIRVFSSDSTLCMRWPKY